MTLDYEVAGGVECLTCGAEEVGVKAHAAGFDYCRTCFYTGVAAEHLRAEHLEVFRSALPDWRVAVEHTGGGCFWLAFTPPNSGGYFYAATDGEASLPSRDEDDHSTPIRNGWGYVGRYFYDRDDDTKTETHPDYEGTTLAEYDTDDGRYWDEYPAHSMTDEQIVSVMLADWERVRSS